MKKKTILPLTSSWNHIVVIGPMLALLLSACGGDSGNTSKAEVDNSGREVATLVDMGRCTSEREGDTVYVAEKMTDYLCQNTSWVDLGNVPYSASDEINASSGIEGPTSSSSGSEEDFPKDFIRENISVTGEAQSGELKKDNETDSIYVYDDSNWIVTEREAAIGLCQNSNIGVVSKFDDTYYICRDNAWEQATVLEYDTYGLTGSEGDVTAGAVNKDKYYVYENGTWRAAANDQEAALGVCTIAREGFVIKDGGTYYICKSKTWIIATALEYDTYGWPAGEDGEIRVGNVNEDRYYEYKNGEWTLSLGSFLTDSRDGRIYRTVTIGTQTWMAENLNYADSIKTPSLLNRSWCYENSADNCAKYGRLYTWAAAIDSAKLYKDKFIDCGYTKPCTLPDTVYGICPPGWHLPTSEEWNTLFKKVGGQSTAAKVLKSQIGWNKDGNGTDSRGFSALPAGVRYSLESFFKGGDATYFWSATEHNGGADVIYLTAEGDNAPLFDSYKNYGRSVRCLQD